MKPTRTMLLLLGAAPFWAACLKQAKLEVVPRVSEPPNTRSFGSSVAWGIPKFFELGRHVQLTADASAVDTTGWPMALLRASDRAPRAYLSATADDQSQVFVYPEPEPNGRVPRYALVIPEPKLFSTNGVVTAFWGRSPSLMNFALGEARSFGSFVSSSQAGSPRVIPLSARLEPSGVNVQDSENVYELAGSRLSVLEHKGLVPEAPLSFSELTVYDRDATTDDSEPSPIDHGSVENVLNVGLTPLRAARWTHRTSFASHGFRVVLVTDAEKNSYFMAAPLEFQPSAGFGEASTDLTLGPLTASDGGDAGAGSAAALTFEHANRVWLLSGTVRNAREVPALLERGSQFMAKQAEARRTLAAGAMTEFAAQAASAFVVSHRSHRDPRTITRFADGDAPQPSNSATLSAGQRYGQDLGSALLGLVSVQQVKPNAQLLAAVVDFAGSSLAAITGSGATFSRSCDQLAILAEHDENSGRSDVFIDNGLAAVAVNHRRLLLASGQTHSPGVTWGAFGATVDGQVLAVDQPGFDFSVDGATLPQSVDQGMSGLSVSRWFTPAAGSTRVRETASLLHRVPAVSLSYQLENRSEQATTLDEARITLADFVEYGAGANEISQNRYGLGHLADGARLPVGFWMEGMQAPAWGDNYPVGEVDLSEEYRRLRPRFLLLFGFDRAQIYFLTRPADRLILHNSDGWTRLEARYRAPVTLLPHQAYKLPEVLSYTLRAPLQSADGDGIPDQLQELAPLWARTVSGAVAEEQPASTAFETDSGHAALVYAWISSAELLSSSQTEAPFNELASRLRQGALRGASFALSSVNALRDQNNWLPTYANGHDYGFTLAVFDWAYRQTCEVAYREAFLALADDLSRPESRGGLQISDPENPSYGAYISTQQSRAGGATQLGDQGIRLWALRIAYERTGDTKYRNSAALLIDHWLRLDPDTHSFTGTVLVAQRYRDAGIEQERTPLGHFAVLVGLKAWSDILPRARVLYSAGLAAAVSRHLVHGVGLDGPRELIAAGEGLADFSDDAELSGTFMWATTLEPNLLRGRFDAKCRVGAR